jgi:hypothetical protein
MCFNTLFVFNRYTSCQKHDELKSKKYRKIRNQLKDNNERVCIAEKALSEGPPRRTNKTETHLKYLELRQQHNGVLSNHYEQSIFRKLRLSAYIRQQKADARLAKNLRTKFGQGACLIMGDWSAPMNKYHEPIKGVGMRRMLVKHGFEVYLLDEYGTSKHCPQCEGRSLEPFKRVPNPRPYRRSNMPTVKCHGLLR